MITPILEKLVVQGLASVNHKTVGQGGVFTISVPKNQSIVITKISIQPFINPQFKEGFGQTAGGFGLISNINDFTQNLIKAFVSDGGTITNGPAGNNIVFEMLRRGTFQVELVSSDNNNTIFTFGTDFNFVNVTGFDPVAIVPAMIMLLPALSERSTDCYSVHKNNVHIRLRFSNKFLNELSTDDYKASFDDYRDSVTLRNLNNTIPENRPIVDINSPYLYFNTAVYTNAASGDKFGFYPFGVETNYQNLGTFNSSDTITFPFWEDAGNVPMAGDGGEASFYSLSKASLIANLKTYMNMFIPYINIEYVLINEKADGNTIVAASRYNNVTVTK